ncbi:MAG: hypothetical protein HUN04_04465 [Desulfobacter sp.]|nr:MAG: hypothetical protein HUN04_04465 [Desulfobacter sp.]
MRRVHSYTVAKENFWEMLHAKRHHHCLEITYRDRSGKYTHKLSAGYGDTVDVYREGPETYVLSRNHRHGYVGLEVFEGPDKTGEIFLDEQQVKETLRRDDLAPYTIIRRLRRHII